MFKLEAQDDWGARVTIHEVSALAILQGVVAGLLTAGLLFTAGFLLKKWAWPAFCDAIYKGQRVDGTWVLEDEHESDDSPYGQHETLKLSQVSATLSGDLLLTPKEGNGHKVLSANGTIKDGFVVLTFNPSNRREQGYAAMVLRVSGDGKVLNGHCVYLDTARDRIREVKVRYTLLGLDGQEATP